MDSSASCRIVVVSQTLETSREVANRIKAIAGDASGTSINSEVIHWTIKNKYYTAPVHFHPIHLDGLESIELDDVPAVIYAWKEKEPFRDHVKQISEHLTSYEPEISLAISTAPTTEDELEDFFFEHGFEYVDGHAHGRSTSLADDENISATPGIHRAIDALSTIMWPSMVRPEPKKPTLADSFGSAGGLDVSDEADLDYEALKDASEGRSNLQREMEMLEKWLEDEDEEENEDGNDYDSLSSHTHSIANPLPRDDPWSTASTSTSPAKARVSDQQGFDDDFTDFVSAPTSSQLEHQSEVRGEVENDLPSEAEIRAASAQIFGSNTSTSSSVRNASALLSSEYLQLDHDPESELHHELVMDAQPFDLSRVFDALQGMKEEISRIPDERARRRAAAKAALGLVYGLEGTGTPTP